mgnify:FL=1
MKTLLWLDDIRDPMDAVWQAWLAQNQVDTSQYKITWVKNYDDFTAHIKFNGMPDLICFDHDLGEDVAQSMVASGMSKRQARIKKRETMSGYDAAKWLVKYCMDNDASLPQWRIQSANPVGADNIAGLFKSFLRNF